MLCLIAIGGFGLNWLGRLNSDMTSALQKRYNTVEATHQTIENSITNARITIQLFETSSLDEEKEAEPAKRGDQSRNHHAGRGN